MKEEWVDPAIDLKQERLTEKKRFAQPIDY